ncbi:hypothetical protein [Mycobacterium colombiense]|uniref:Uncharacterized protein n=1 Tax=Mycobacterium colombiense TaxID=339268 RepID=A0A853M4P7_9MYCO|nr:hypothetical protein [Mycobacterium colombiense]OBJ16209.1 hypothetical protein A5623_18865 [Mycobacterium colombiense]OBJ63875.1 hypothetical protein A5628_22000 [Mycobacterium colombiense]
MVEWLAFVVSLLALGVSAAAYRSGIPRLTVKAKGPVMLVDAERSDLETAIIVTVVNDGGQIAYINRVSLHGGGLVGKLSRGEQQRIEIGPRGDKRTWIFDYNDLRDQLAEQARTEFRDPKAPVLIQATVETGTKVMRTNAIQVNPPGVAEAHQTKKDRWRRRYQSWRRPYPMILGGIALRDESAPDLPHVMISNSDRGVIRRGKLVLVVEHEDGSRARVASVAPVRTPSVWGRRSRSVEVPFLDESMVTAGETYSWVFQYKDALRWGQPAHAFTSSEARATQARYAEEKRLRNTPNAN